MRTLYKQLLDGQISRRDFAKELAVLGVSVGSVSSLLASVANAAVAENDAAKPGRTVTGNGSDLLAESLLDADVEYFFHGCGGGINGLFDSLVRRPAVKNILATHESQCIAMAEGYHLASGGKLGVAIIPRPGLPNAAGNILNAMAHRSSLLIITARESNEYSHRRGNNELVEWDEVMDPFTKWNYKMEQVERVPEFTRRAIKVTHAPLGGPVFLGMTEDLFTTEGTAEILPQDMYRVEGRVEPDSEVIEKIAGMLLSAEKPLIIAGLEVTKSGAQQDLIDLAELLSTPVTQGLSLFADFPNQHPLSLGMYSRFLGYTRGVDLVIIIGAQMPDEGHYIITGPLPEGAAVVHISMDSNLLAMSRPTDLALMADAGEAILALTAAVKQQASKRQIRAIRDAHYQPVVDYVTQQRERMRKRAERRWDQAPITNARLSTELNEALEDDAIVVSESLYGVPEWFDFGPEAKQQIGPQPGEILGWATGVAVGAKLPNPTNRLLHYQAMVPSCSGIICGALHVTGHPY